MRATHMLVPLAILATFAAGCGDDDADADATSASTAAASTAAASTGAQAATDAPEPVEIVAVDYGFEGVPPRVPVGTPLSMRNESSVEIHEFIAYRLADDEERSAEELMALPEEELGALFAGEPDFGLVAPPGEASFAVIGDGTLTEPGRYLIFCAIPQGADPAEAMVAMQEAVQSNSGPPQIEGGAPHFVHGMYGELVVE